MSGLLCGCKVTLKEHGYYFRQSGLHINTICFAIGSKIKNNHPSGFHEYRKSIKKK